MIELGSRKEHGLRGALRVLNEMRSLIQCSRSSIVGVQLPTRIARCCVTGPLASWPTVKPRTLRAGKREVLASRCSLFLSPGGPRGRDALQTCSVAAVT